MLDALLYTDALALACLFNELHLRPDGDRAYEAVSTCAANQGHSFDFGGSPGLLLLSKHRLRNVQVQEFASWHTRKVVLYAGVNGVRLAFSYFPYDLEIPPPFPSPDIALQDGLAQHILDKGVDVAFGSFNSGPEYQHDGFNLFLVNGWSDVSTLDTFCTAEIAPSDPRCADEAPLGIDHIFIKTTKPLTKLVARRLTGVQFNNVPGLSSHAEIGLKLKKR
jgi:hypothetical protein